MSKDAAVGDSSLANLGCLVTTPVGEFEPNGYKLHTVSGNIWEWYSEWTYSRFQLRNVAQTKAADIRGNLRGRSPPYGLSTCISFVHPNRKESSERRRYQC